MAYVNERIGNIKGTFDGNLVVTEILVCNFHNKKANCTHFKKFLQPYVISW